MRRIGLAGYGLWGASLARNVAAAVGEPAFLCDPSPERLAAGKAAFPHCFVTADWSVALAQPVDGIVIASPSSQHFSMAGDALAAGKHVFIEKPLALSTNHAQLLVEQASRRNLHLMVDHTYLFSPAIRAAARLIADGAIGRPTRFTSERLNAGGIRADAPVHWDLATHDLAILDYLLPGTPDSICAVSSPGVHAVDLSLRFPTGLNARISVSWVAPAKRRVLEVEGTRGSLLVDDLQGDRKLRLFDAETATHSFPELEGTEPLAAAIEHFVDCLEQNCAPLSSGASALRGIRLLAAADESLQNQGMEVMVGCPASA